MIGGLEVGYALHLARPTWVVCRSRHVAVQSVEWFANIRGSAHIGGLSMAEAWKQYKHTSSVSSVAAESPTAKVPCPIPELHWRRPLDRQTLHIGADQCGKWFSSLH